MPTYEYQCSKCAHEFEIEQRITADRLKKCPECKKMKLIRLVGTGNFILKGGGWYADAYSGSSNKKPSSGTTSGKGSQGSGGSKTEKGSSKSSEKSSKASSPKGGSGKASSSSKGD